MVPSSVPADTDARSWAGLVETWRSMSVIERAELTDQLCRDVEELARLDIARRYPEYTEIEVCHELARRRYGPELADAAYAGLV